MIATKAKLSSKQKKMTDDEQWALLKERRRKINKEQGFWKSMYWRMVRIFYFFMMRFDPDCAVWFFTRGLAKQRNKWEKELPAKIEASVKEILAK